MTSTREPLPAYFELAERFLTERNYIVNSQLHIRYWQDGFYVWDGLCYHSASSKDILAEITRWLQDHTIYRRNANIRTVNEINLNLKGICLIDSRISPPIWLNESKSSAGGFVALKNGVLNVENIFQGQTMLLPHDSTFFNLSALPYDFDSNSQCPIWLAFLEQTLPDLATRELLQEWFGLNLIFNTRYAKFVLLLGEGANGKSVVCVVLRELLGENNVSAVGLEAFNPSRTFPLAATVGKLANIVEELNEIDKAAEGLLKQFVAGGLITIERKRIDAFSLIPTARLTFATNILPRFADRTDGLWRRIIVIPFKVQILDEAKQDKRLVDPLFWRSSSELPGIFNWAAEGLSRLSTRDRFLEPKECSEAKNAYKKDSNPAKVFLTEYCKFNPGEKMSTSVLYQEYRKYAEEFGIGALGEPQFAKEVTRVFPQAHKSKNAVHFESKRCHVWYGLQFRGHGDATDTGDTTHSHFAATEYTKEGDTYSRGMTNARAASVDTSNPCSEPFLTSGQDDPYREERLGRLK